ncbi:MAG TPA: LuxR C-terminal-related transcriptional regulator [Anaerolineales bacterium]|nr:LuxR C-terminal-related transcriptional regulator [Anaerolineales bacterium]
MLTTKLYVPPGRETLVARPRLMAILGNAMEKGFTLVSAPAGYGKTTLVSNWLRETGVPCAWLSLEESDNDPVRFMQYLLTALQMIVPGIHLDLLDMVEGIQPAAFQAVISISINEITRQASRFVLVMDDFHLIQDPLILDIVAFLLDHIPAQHMHLVLITRTDPPLPLSHLRVRNQMVEIRADQLRFTQSEVAELVNHLMGFSLSNAEISAMHARTEGWIAGLQLAGLSMQDCKDIPGFITAFSGSHHYIVDYLAEEVLKHQDEQTRVFLLQTSILSRMCASLCDALVDIKPAVQPIDGQSMLESLQKKNLFIIPLDEERRWYRYHHLFSDALARRLEYQYPELLLKLCQHASEWYEKKGLIDDAIQYALRGGELDRVAQLVEQNGCYLLMSGEVLTLVKWMESVEDYFPTHPWLVIQKGWALTLAGRMEPAEQAFQTAEQLVSTLAATPDVNSMIGTISAGRAYWADIQGNIAEAARLAQQALDLLPDTDPLSQSMRSVATGALAKTIFVSGDLDRARRIYDQAVEFGKTANNVEMIINTTNEICFVLYEQGQLRQVECLLLEISPMTVRADGQRLPISGRVHSGLSKVYYEWNNLEQADYHLRQCLEISQQWGNIEQQAAGMIMLAKVELAKGNLEQAQALMTTAEQLNRDHSFYPWNSIRISAALDRYWLTLGSTEKVSRHIEADGITPSDEITYLQEHRYLTLLRYLVACGDYDPALGLAERLLNEAMDEGRMLQVVQLLIIRAIIYYGKKDMDAAVNSLARAVTTAQPEGYKRVFLDESEVVRKLLYLVKSNREAAEYAGELLNAFEPISGPTSSPGQFLIEPLSGREIEVLKLIEAGLSNQDIASRLFISITTVKRHISNIYAKLDVKTRTQAVSRGKELGFFEV